MRERAEQIGGSFVVSSSPDTGTQIDIVAPAYMPSRYPGMAVDLDERSAQEIVQSADALRLLILEAINQ